MTEQNKVREGSNATKEGLGQRGNKGKAIDTKKRLTHTLQLQ